MHERNPESLHDRILEVNEAKKPVRKFPPLEEVKDWVKQARKLPRKVEY